MRQKSCLKFKRLTSAATAPYKASDGAACVDLFVSQTETIYPQRGQEKAYLIHTGIALDIPKGYHAEVYLRSSTGKDTKFRLANGAGGKSGNWAKNGGTSSAFNVSAIGGKGYGSDGPAISYGNGGAGGAAGNNPGSPGWVYIEYGGDI